VEIEYFPPSGPWVGYYLYGHAGPKHQMHLSLTFNGGSINGDGTDDIGPFLIRGAFDGSIREASWTKSYVGMHTVEYRGLYDGRSICGDWSLIVSSGGFWIWPSTLREMVTESIEEELDQPAPEVHLSIRTADSF
jgi:hypothetical protein